MAELALGTIFKSTEDAKACVKRYNEVNSANFVIRSNSSSQLQYSCRHGIQRRSRSTGARPNQHYNYVGCEAGIRMYKSKSGGVKVTQSNLTHTNHIVPVKMTAVTAVVKREDPAETLSDFVDPEETSNSEDDGGVPLTDSEKYNILRPVLSKIASAASCHPTNTFLRYVQELKAVGDKVRRGESITAVHVSPSPTSFPQWQENELQDTIFDSLTDEMHVSESDPIPLLSSDSEGSTQQQQEQQQQQNQQHFPIVGDYRLTTNAQVETVFKFENGKVQLNSLILTASNTS